MLDSSIIKELKNIVGKSNLFISPEELTVYSYDATRASALPWAVARPATAREVSGIVRLANRRRFPVIPRGAGTGMSGGSVPAQGGVVLSFERMNRIVDIDVADRTAIVQPGVITGDLHAAVEARGLFYPPDPASSAFCTIGGNVAECAGGLRAVKYGVTRDYVLGLEAVLPTGEIIRTGSRTHKSVAGYDLTRLFVGSEGTLGIATEIVLKLVPLPETVRTLAAFFSDTATALAALPKITAAGIMPRALEFVDSGALHAAEDHLGYRPSDGAGAMLLIETDGPALSARTDIERIGAICGSSGAVKIYLADDPAERERLWKLRRSISPALYALKPRKLNEDIVVPLSRIAGILAEIDGIAKKHKLHIVNFGHAGDGNIHINVMHDDDERGRAEQAVSEILAAVVRMQGSITGEHGIGLSKAQYLPLEAGADSISVMKKIKQAMDPNNILNPGKIFLCLCLFAAILLFSLSKPAGAEDVSSEEDLRKLEEEVAVYEEQNQGLRKLLHSQEEEDPYIVVDTENNRLTLRQGEKVLLTAVVGTGSRQYIEEETGRNWYFESPLGSLAVLGKERNPVWIRPDWSYVEENMPIPPMSDPDRLVREVLGKYALILGNGYKIHGTKYTELLGTHFTHGCISVGDKNLEYLYKNVKVGTKVYIY